MQGGTQMAAKKDPTNALPLTVENDQTPSATITYATDVVAIIAGLAANEVEGIAGMCNVSGNILNKNRNVTRGVKVEMGTEEVAVDLYVVVEYGTPIQRAAMDAQESVRKAIESMTGLHVVRVDVHVQSVSFERENKALQAGAASAALEAGSIVNESSDYKEPAIKKPVPDIVPVPEPLKSNEPEASDAESDGETESKASAPQKKNGKNRKKPADASSHEQQDKAEE